MKRATLLPSASAPELERKTNWKAAVISGLIVGAIFLFATAGNPWGFSAMIVPTVMGREIVVPGGAHLNFFYLGMHLLLSVLFTLAMAPIINRFHIWKALALGGLFGLLFYGINRLLFSFMDVETNSPEIAVLLTNIAFALVTAAAYRGIVRRN